MHFTNIRGFRHLKLITLLTNSVPLHNSAMLLFIIPPKSCYAALLWREGAPGWGGRCTSRVFTPGRATQGVKATLLHPAKA
ncbi:hypothetical protein CEXT_345561 [Caerostris extrusa]|uniref:Secreted protein n=1 Tax=Caerostris extrusa TaxID=172846 RepID=A0AAV4QP95_CAEEX|nr:hypothetical protein CEXT_345561 [Caerostris extrusa]